MQFSYVVFKRVRIRLMVLLLFKLYELSIGLIVCWLFCNVISMVLGGLCL